MNIQAAIEKHEALIKILLDIKAQGQRIKAMRRGAGESQRQFSECVALERYAKKLMKDGYARRLKALKNFTK